MKFSIFKVSADGEQINVEIQVGQKALTDHANGVKHLRETPEIAAAFDLIDARLLEMNKRIMAMNYMVGKLDANARVAIVNILEVMHGKTGASDINAIVEQSREEALATRKAAEERVAAAKAASPLQGEGQVVPLVGAPAVVE